MSTIKKYVCKYCGAERRVSSTTIPLKTKCPKRKPSGLHVWVRVDLK